MKNHKICFDFIPDVNILQKIFDDFESTHQTQVMAKNSHGDMEVEHIFLAKIEYLKRYCSDLLLGKMREYEKYLNPMRKIDMENFENILKGAFHSKLELPT